MFEPILVRLQLDHEPARPKAEVDPARFETQFALIRREHLANLDVRPWLFWVDMKLQREALGLYFIFYFLPVLFRAGKL